MTQHKMIRHLSAILALAMAGCGPPKSFETYDEIGLEISAAELPVAAIDSIPVNVGIYYDRWFIDHRISVFVKAEGVTPYEIRRYVVDLGEPSIAMVEQAAAAMFSHSERLDEHNWRTVASKQDLDAVLRPSITSVRLNQENYIQYQFRLYSRQGEIIDEWWVTGRSAGSASGDALAKAMRDAAAHFMVQLAGSEKVKHWLEGLETTKKAEDG